MVTSGIANGLTAGDSLTNALVAMPLVDTGDGPHSLTRHGRTNQ